MKVKPFNVIHLELNVVFLSASRGEYEFHLEIAVGSQNTRVSCCQVGVDIEGGEHLTRKARGRWLKSCSGLLS